MRISDWSSDVCSSDLTVVRDQSMVGRPTGERGSSVMQQCLVSFSKYSLPNLALRSIVELDRLNAGLDRNPAVFTNLATALRQNSEPSARSHQFHFVEPSYYETCE